MQARKVPTSDALDARELRYQLSDAREEIQKLKKQLDIVNVKHSRAAKSCRIKEKAIEELLAHNANPHAKARDIATLTHVRTSRGMINSLEQTIDNLQAQLLAKDTEIDAIRNKAVLSRQRARIAQRDRPARESVADDGQQEPVRREQRP